MTYDGGDLKPAPPGNGRPLLENIRQFAAVFPGMAESAYQVAGWLELNIKEGMLPLVPGYADKLRQLAQLCSELAADTWRFSVELQRNGGATTPGEDPVPAVPQESPDVAQEPGKTRTLHLVAFPGPFSDQ